MINCAYEQIAHGLQWIVSIGVTNKRQRFQHSWALPNDLKHTEASFSMILTDLLCLQVAQMPRSPDLVIFVLTDRQTDRWTESYPLRMELSKD
jgi:hypothetical protein